MDVRTNETTYSYRIEFDGSNLSNSNPIKAAETEPTDARGDGLSLQLGIGEVGTTPSNATAEPAHGPSGVTAQVAAIKRQIKAQAK